MTNALQNYETQKKVVLVTGAFSGIGEETALYFAERGYVVYASGRNLDKSKGLSTRALGRASGNFNNLRILKLDVCDKESISSALTHIEKAEGRLDVLVNNAGFGLMGAVVEATDEQLRYQFEVNTFGPVILAREALRLMRRGSQGRIINVTSALGRFVFPGTGIYAASKYALEAFSDALRMELKIFGPDFHVILVEPGIIKTKFTENIVETSLVEKTKSVYENTLVDAQKRFDNRPFLAGQPRTVARTIFKASTTRFPKARYVVTVGAHLTLVAEKYLPTKVFDRIKTRIAGLEKKPLPKS